MFELNIELAFQIIQKNRYRLESVSVRIGKMYRIGIGIGMLFFLNKKSVSVSVCYLILKIGIGIGKVKIFKMGIGSR